jgi:hypothetical protein
MSSDVRRRDPVPLPSDLAAARRAMRAARLRRRRRQQHVIVAIFVAAALLLAAGFGWRMWRAAQPSGTARTPSSLNEPEPTGGLETPAVGGLGSVSPSPAGPRAPSASAGRFAYVTTAGAVLGSAGTLKRFRIAIEGGAGVDPAAFAAAADTVLGDSRSWVASGQVRFQRVAGDAAAEFTVFLATPATSETMCLAGGFHTNRYTSCRLSGKVIINVARWMTAIPNYGAPLSVYQAYALNHEVGHELGHGHEACPGTGQLAPVMQQQTFGLKGCLANAWPYVNGQLYSGPKLP